MSEKVVTCSSCCNMGIQKCWSKRDGACDAAATTAGGLRCGSPCRRELLLLMLLLPLQRSRWALRGGCPCTRTVG
jgi:hypothetical protein